MYCICCKKNNVNSFDKESKSEEEFLWEKEERKDGGVFNVNNQMVDNGIIHIIDAGYGSIHDGGQFIIAICDDCIDKNKEDGSLLYYDNYMDYDDRFAKQEKERSKTIYRRRKNLDVLV